jgi:hypothetical protein
MSHYGNGETTVALVRPYTITQGRTRPRHHIAIEALIGTTVRGRDTDYGSDSAHGQEHRHIAQLCSDRLQSLAEITAYIRLPLGVTRVLVSDMAARQLLGVHDPIRFDDTADPIAAHVLQRVLSRLRTL